MSQLREIHMNSYPQKPVVARPKIVSQGGCYTSRVLGLFLLLLCAVGLSVRAASTTDFKAISSSLLQLESCLPANGYIDPGETNTVVFVIQNTHGDVLKNVKAQLLGDVDQPVFPLTGQQTLGDIAKDGVITLQFQFRANGNCGDTLVPTIRLTSDTFSGNEDLAFSGNNDNGQALSFQLGATVTSTYSFSNTAGITIPDTFADSSKLGRASSYPTTVAVSGVPNVSGTTGERVKGVSVTLNGLSFGWSPNLQVLLVGPKGQAVVLMAGAGGLTATTAPINNANVTISSSASSQLPHGVGAAQIVTGSYTPFSRGNFGANDFPSPAPASSTFSADLSAFNDIDSTGNWQLYVQNAAAGFSGQIAGGWTLNLTTTKISCCGAGQTTPVLGSFAPGDTSIAEDAATSDNPIKLDTFKIWDVENSSSLDQLTLTATSSNPGVVNASNLVFKDISASSSTRSLWITHSETHAFGSTVITVTVADPQGHTASSSFNLTVNFVNHNPTISSILNQQMITGQTTPALPFTVGDVEDSPSILFVTAASDNTAVVPVNNIFIVGNPPNGTANRTVTVSPNGNTTGSANITLTVHDSNGGSSSTTFLVSFNATAGGPTITPMSNQNVDENKILTVPFNVRTASSTPASALTVSVVENTNPGVLASANGIIFGGSDTSRTVTFSPNSALTQTASTLLKFRVTDPNTGLTSDTPEFSLTVNFINNPPTISAIPNQVINQGTTTGTGPIAFTVNDVETPAAALVVSAISSNPSLIPNPPATNIVIATPAPAAQGRTINVFPAAGQFGTAVITVGVLDGNGGTNSTTFLVTVNAVNQPPTMTNPGDETIAEDSGTAITDSAAHTVTVSLAGISPGGPGEFPQTVNISAASSNPSVLSVVKVDPGSYGPFTLNNGQIVTKTGTLTLTLQPHKNTCGTDPVKITLTLTDNGGTDNGGNNTSTTSFNITVSPVNYAPTFTINPNNTVDLNNVPKNQALAIPITLTDVETPAPLITVVGTVLSETSATGHNDNVVQGILTNPANTQITIVLNPMFTNATTLAELPYVINFKVTATDQAIGCGTTSQVVTQLFAITIKNIEPPTLTVSPNVLNTDEDVVAVTVLSITDNHPIANELRPLQPLSSACIASSGYSTELSGHSDNQDVVPDGGIFFGNLSQTDTLNGARTIAIVPGTHKSGTAHITITGVDDECLSDTATLTVVVRAVPHPPTIAMVSATPIAVNENGVTSDSTTKSGQIELTVDDVDTGPSSLTVTADSSNHDVVPVAGIAIGNQSSTSNTRTLTITPAANQFGTNITITVTATDPGGLSASTQFNLTVRHINQPPTMDQPATVNLAEGAGQQAITLTGVTPGPANEQPGGASPQGFTIKWYARDAANTNQNTITTDGLTTNTISASDIDVANKKATLRFTPLPTASGSSIFYITTTDIPNAAEDATADNTKPKSITLMLNVNVAFQNHTPTISFSSSQSVTITTVNVTRASDGTPQATPIIPIYLSDVEQSSGVGLILTAVSTNPLLIPNDAAHLQLGGSGVNRGLVIQAAPSQAGGTGSVVLTVLDLNGATAQATVNVTVPASTAPSITSIPNQTIHVNEFTDLIQFTVSDANTPPDQLVVYASASSNPLLVPLSANNIQFGGSGGSRAMIILPVANQTGSSVITVSVKNNLGNVTSTSFTLTVLGAPPTISPATLQDQTVGIGQKTAAQTVIVGSANTFPGFLVVTGKSSNQAAVPDGNIFVLGSNTNRTVTVLAGNTAGTALITLTVSDNSGQTATSTFNLTVVDNTTPPTIVPNPLPDQVTGVNKPTGLITFTVNDAVTPPGSLVTTATSGNTNVVAQTGILVLQSPSNPSSRSLIITPVQNATGTALITVKVTNNANKSAIATFNLTVRAVTVANDFNGDGIPDILFEDNAGNLAAWFMSGDDLSSASMLTPAATGDPNWRIVDTGDFNKDGSTDILFQHADGSLAVWLMNGTSLTTSQFTSPANSGSPSWKAVAVADFNKDGNPDILFQNTDGSLAIWYMNGLTLSSVATLNPGNSGVSWHAVGTGDANGDGNTDIFFQNDDGTLGIWYMNGPNLILASLLTPSFPGSADWRVMGVTDLNGDGKPDLLFQNRANGTLAIWYMNGANLLLGKQLTPSNAGGTWQIAAPK
jgi:hypothetical protein